MGTENDIKCNNYKAEITCPPTYIREFFVDDEEIILVYDKRDISYNDDISPQKAHIKKEINDNSSALDLTGTPLKVDLEGDESFGSCGKCVRLNHWTVEESTHFPLSIQWARFYINRQNRIKNSEGEKQNAIYVVCDGSDSLCAVLLGSQKCNSSIMTTLVDFLVKFKYYLYGTFLQNFRNVTHTEHHGSISVEVTCNKCVFNVPQNPSSMKMVLKIIAGHNLSSVYFLWEELCLLQTYLDILSDSDKCNDELTIISNAPIPEPDIYRNINNIIGSHLLKREAKMKFDLKNIRQEHILDNLWDILKCCEDLSVLRDTLHYFFEELVEADSNIKIPESDNKFQNEELTAQSGHRKTRITVNLKSGVIDLCHNISKLAYLGKLHVATELIFLIKGQANLPEETFDYFCERVYKNYVVKDTAPHDFTDLQRSPLCPTFQYSVSHNVIHDQYREVEAGSYARMETPVIWAMQMTSTVRNLEITTTYHLSEHPIFPTTVYDSYVVFEILKMSSSSDGISSEDMDVTPSDLNQRKRKFDEGELLTNIRKLSEEQIYEIIGYTIQKTTY
ncbi:hypothetical protein NQ314_007867 [Rhamnusium bicolor]|uniref:Uncharacterized protein n=1 Tax=Rhamnusium bicolor TaxID=1586634 RepID=A0AAV8YGV8_9CUCU|nr:hypothetical protein NQ314_007867 [Rhamnusium bicolor]